MIWPMANNHVLTSKNPRIEAKPFMPRATKMIRTVLMVTTQSSAKKTSNGSVGNLGAMAAMSESTVELLL
jgi:hypothetical protein